MQNQAVGETLSPFKTGRRVPGNCGRARVIPALGSEYILPGEIKPTGHQKKVVVRREKASDEGTK